MPQTLLRPNFVQGRTLAVQVDNPRTGARPPESTTSTRSPLPVERSVYAVCVHALALQLGVVVVIVVCVVVTVLVFSRP